jgi:hypothetical protein
VQTGKTYSIHADQAVRFPANLKVEGGKLLAIRIPEGSGRPDELMVEGQPGASCENLRLEEPVDFYIAETAAAQGPLKTGQELWIEVTVPSKGAPRPIQLAMKDGGAWRPLAFQ